jgi:hypothetical protein
VATSSMCSIADNQSTAASTILCCSRLECGSLASEVCLGVVWGVVFDTFSLPTLYFKGFEDESTSPSSATRVFSRIPTMSEKHLFSRAFITNWDFLCRAVRGVAGGCVPRLSLVCPQISSRFSVSVATVSSYPTTGPPGEKNRGRPSRSRATQ